MNERQHGAGAQMTGAHPEPFVGGRQEPGARAWMARLQALARRSPGLVAGVMGLVVVLCTLASVAATGFQFGISNNVFHIPIVLGWADDPVFRGDAFYASLSHFTSVVWPLVTLLATEANVEALFALLHYLSRGLAFVALAVFLHRGLALPWLATALALGVLAVSPWLVGTSPVGGHGLFLSYFTHSEVTWGFLVFAWLALLRQRYAVAAALIGVVFSINAFIGVWSVIALGVAALARSERLPPVRTVLASAVAFLVFAAPAIVWIAAAVNGGVPDGFSFREYIRLYYPDHFLIEAARAPEVAEFVLVAVGGFAAAALLPDRRLWWGLLGGYLLVVLVGIPLPYLVDSRVVFNLVLLRADGVVYFLSIVLLAGAFVRTGFAREAGERAPFALAGLLLLMAPTVRTLEISWLGVAAVAAVAIGLVLQQAGGGTAGRSALRRAGPVLLAIGVVLFWAVALLEPSQSRVLWAVALTALPFAHSKLRAWRPAIGLAALVGFTVLSILITVDWRRHAEWKSRRDLAGWTALAEWVRHSPHAGPFLVDLRTPADSFQLLARRPVWVDWKQGAAAMWQPGFGPRWMQRYREVSTLRDGAGLLRYAELQRIDQVVMVGAAADCAGAWRAAFERDGYVVCVRD